MSKQLKHRKQMCETKSLWEFITILPILIVILIVPLVVKGVQVDTYLSNYAWYGKANKIIDIFLYSKSVVFLVSCGLMLVCIMINSYIKNIHWKEYIRDFRVYIVPLGIYATLTILSTICSDYKSIALRGMVDQYESMWTLLGYILLVFYIVMFLKSAKQVHIVISVLNVMIVIVILIGLSQVLKHDFFKTDIGRSLISKQPLTFNFNEGHVYSTLYNPNYVGLFASLLFPVVAFQIIYAKTKAMKILSSCISIGLLACALGSKSSSGIIGIIAGTLVLAIAFVIKKCQFIKKFQLIKKHKKMIIIFSSILGFSILGGIMILGNRYMHNTKNQTLSPKLTSIQTMDDHVSIVYDGKEIKISMTIQNDSYLFKFLDENNNEIPYSISNDGQTITVNDKVFEKLRFYLVNYDNKIAFGIDVDNSSWYFTKQVDNTYYYCNNYGKLLKLNEMTNYKQYRSLFSGRGYIWERSLPILKQHWLLGTGPDTYALYFPNTDYLDLFHYGFQGQIITKPHSIYLQIATHTGLPSLITFIVFYVIYFIVSIRLYLRKSVATYEVQLGISILAGTFGYMIACLANDSTITVAPLYWSLIGIGIVLNQIIKKTS